VQARGGGASSRIKKAHCQGRRIAIGTVARSSSAVKPNQATSQADKCDGGLELFLKGAKRSSTIAFGKWLWERLANRPEGAPVNLSEAARDLGLSRPTLYRALRFFTRFGRLLEVDGYATGTGRPGRPRAYRLHPAYVADGNGNSAERVNPPHARDKVLNLPPRKEKINLADTRRCPPQAQPLRLGRPVSEQGRRWALGTIRRELLRWGIPGKARGEIMAGIANSLTRAIKTRKIRTGRELGQTVRLILATLDQDPELRASQLVKRDKRALHSGAGMIVARAVARVERDREAEQATQELLAEIRKEREEARRSWAAFNRPKLEAEARKRQELGGDQCPLLSA